MDIYSSDADFFFFTMPYNSKRLLDDSVTRTLQGFHSIGDGKILSGVGNVLLARVESVAAFCFTTMSVAIFTIGSVVLTPCFMIVAIPLNVASRIPGVSSFESVKNFTQMSSDAISRIFKVNYVAIKVNFLFLSASAVNTILPGILKPQNLFFRAIHSQVKHLGPLLNIRAVVPGVTEVVGTREKVSALEGMEEYLRAFSSQNYLDEVKVKYVLHHYTSTRYA